MRLFPVTFRIRLVFLFTIVFSMFLFSCSEEDSASNLYHFKDGLIYKGSSDKPFTGSIKDTVNGKIVEYDVIDGKKHGKFSISVVEGIVVVEGTTEENKNVGEWIYYYFDGIVESKGKFKDDKPDGRWTWYYEDGTLKEEGVFLDGDRTGEWIVYAEDGEVAKKIFYNNGEIVYKIELEKYINI